MTLFDARHLAPMWLSVAVASGTEKYSPVLCRTISIEAFETGVRLTATDSYTLLTAWVPALDPDADGFDRHEDFGELAPTPALDEAPYATAVAVDAHGRAKGLLRHAWHLATQKDAMPLDIRLELGVVDLVADGEQSLDGMSPSWVTLEIPDKERVKLRTYEGEFPSWRGLLGSLARKRTAGVDLMSDRLSQMAKLAALNEGQPLRFTFGGRSSAVHVEVVGRPLEGMVMPLRTDMETGDPLTDDDEPDAEADGGES